MSSHYCSEPEPESTEGEVNKESFLQILNASKNSTCLWRRF